MKLFRDFRRRSAAHWSAELLDVNQALLACFQLALGHELPSGLLVMQGFARMVQEQGPGLEEERHALLSRLVSVTQRADGLVRRLAQIGRLCREPVTGPAVCLGEVVREAVAGVKVLCGGQSFECIIADDLPRVPLSGRVIHEVLVQLLRNAVAAAEPTRPLRIEVGGQPIGDGYEFWVRDNGRGLVGVPETQLFEPFPRGRNPDGQGLGLFLVRQMVALWGGTIRVDSEAGEGTSFTLWLPTNPEEYRTRNHGGITATVPP
jgi:signal transduction histidine kinase